MPAPAPASLIDVDRDELTPVAVLAQKRLGKRPSPPTIWRWILRGCSAGPHRVKLEAVKHSGVWHTTPEAWGAFIRAQTTGFVASCAASSVPADGDDATPPRSDKTTRRLAAAGLA